MAFAILVCALILFTIVYFAALMTAESALWLKNRVALMQRPFTTKQNAR